MIYGQKFLQYSEDYNPNISADKILEICNFFETVSLTESQQEEIINEAASNVTGLLNKVGVKDTSKVNQKISKTSKECADKIKKDGINKDTTKFVKSKINDLYDSLSEDIDITIDPTGKLKEYETTKIKKSILLLLFVVLTNSLCMAIFSILTGQTIGQVLTAVIVAPLTEEGGKQIAIKGGYITEYQVVFNLYEASSYIIKMTIGGIPILNAIRARVACIGMHVTTSIIQWLTTNETIQKKLGMDSEKDKDKLRTIGNITGIVIHCTWNSFASFSPKFNNMVLGMDVFGK